jgi:hypothetical protein
MTQTPTEATVLADVRAAVDRWFGRGPEEAPRGALSLRFRTDRHGLESVAERAITLVENAAHQDAVAGDVVVVPKAPHIGTAEGVAMVVARLLAFGAEVRRVHRVKRSPLEMAAALYPVTALYFDERPPTSSTLWQDLLEQFAVSRFETVFGQPFDPEVVKPARQIIEEDGLDLGTVGSIWATGRAPLPCEDLVSRYGGRSTCRELVRTVPTGTLLKRALGHRWLHRSVGWRALRRRPQHMWFGCTLPLGIQRIGSGLMAFALRHQQIAGGSPTVMLNGHFPALADLFSDETLAIDVSLPPSVLLTDLRQWVIGSATRPDFCQPGSIRRDALDGRFRVDGGQAIDPRANVVHCSDGLLAGARERFELFGGPPAGALVERLIDEGLTADELVHVIFANPLVGPSGGRQHLTDLTRGQDVHQCATTVLRYLPAVFGERNLFASGVRRATLARAIAELVAVGGEPRRHPEVAERRRRPITPVPRIASLDSSDETWGRAAMGAGTVGFVVPAGGTGGRFGGYDMSESDCRRHKPLAPLLRWDDSMRCALDIRLANAAYWRNESGAQVPVAVMASATNQEAIDAWRGNWAKLDVGQLDMFCQRGVYRLTQAGLADLVASGRAERWADHLLRDHMGAPSLKPFGALGCLTAFALEGLYEKWRNSGIDTLVVSSADDAAFRFDPRIVGYMIRNELDAVVIGVPQGFRARLRSGAGKAIEIRGDASGWCIDHHGRPCDLELLGNDRARVSSSGTTLGTATLTIDIGGVISEVKRRSGWSPAVVEGLKPAAALRIGSLFCANQLYLRCKALDEFLARGPDGVADLVDALPTFAEQKVIDGTAAVQFVQPVAGVLRVLDRVGALAIQRPPAEGQRGGYGAMKERADVPFTQHMLDMLARRGDELLFPDTTN